MLQFVEKEEVIAKSIANQEQIKIVLQEKLRDFGLTKNESKIYIGLNKTGHQRALAISREEEIPRTETYHLLSSLKSKGIIEPSIQRPTKFSAVPIEEALESIILYQEKQIRELDKSKQDLIDLWNVVQGDRKPTKKEFLKFESSMEKYAQSFRMREDLKKNLKKIRENQSDDLL